MNSILNFSQERTIRADSSNLHSELHPPTVDTVTMLVVIMHAGFLKIGCVQNRSIDVIEICRGIYGIWSIMSSQELVLNAYR